MSEPAAPVSFIGDDFERYRARVHGAVFLPPALIWGVPLLMIGLFYLTSDMLDGVFVRWPIAPSVMAKKGWIVFALLAAWLGLNLTIGGLKAFIAWFSTAIVVHPRKVSAAQGLIRRTTLEQRLSKVDAVVVHQGPLGRIFNFGTVDLRGGRGGLEPLKWIADPAALKSAIEEAIEAAEARDRREAAQAAFARPAVVEPVAAAEPIAEPAVEPVESEPLADPVAEEAAAEAEPVVEPQPESEPSPPRVMEAP